MKDIIFSDFGEKLCGPSGINDLMDDLGILGDLPESNQLSLFDFA